MPRDKTPPGELRSKKADQLEMLIRLYSPDILRYAAWRLKERHQAEDVTQETFIKAARYLGTLSSRGKFRALLYMIAANLCIDTLRKQRTEPLEDTIENTENGFAEAEARDGFEWMLKFLSAEQQEIVSLRYGHDLRIREVADALGLRGVLRRAKIMETVTEF